MSRIRRVSLPRALPLAAVLVVPLLPAVPAHAGALASSSTARTPASVGAVTDAATRDVPTDAAVLVTASAARAVRTPLRVTSRGRQAVRWAENRHTWPTRTCMVFVRTALGVSGRYPTPRVAWSAAHHRHRTKHFNRIPAGVPVYTAGRTAPGHIVLSLGNGKVRSTDWPRAGRVGTVKLRTLLRSWHHHYLGWSEDLNGVRVWHR